MPTNLSAEQRNRTVRAFLKLCIASSILQCALILAIYWFHLSLAKSYVLASIPIAPLGPALLAAVRKRASETDPYIRRAYVGAMITLGFMTAMILVLIPQSVATEDRVGFAINSAMPLLFGCLLALTLWAPKGMLSGGSLGDVLLPVRNKLATPTRNRICRTIALFFVYSAISFISRILFDSYAPTGALAYTIVLLPVLPLFGLIHIYNKYMAEEQDEFQRHLFHKSILFAFFGSLVFAGVTGRLQDHALISQHVSHIYRPYSVEQILSWGYSDLNRPYSLSFFLFLQWEAFYIPIWIQSRRVSAQAKLEKKDQ